MTASSRTTPPTEARDIETSEQLRANPAGAVAGAAAGAAVGAVTGIAAGPVGSLAGAVVGAAAGGLVAARGTAGAGGTPTGTRDHNLTASTQPPDVSAVTDPAADAADRARSDGEESQADKDRREQAETALDNVREGHEKAPPGAGGEPSWPTGGNISRGPKRAGP